MQGEENNRGEIAGVIVTVRAQLYALEQAIARDDAELIADFSRRLAHTAGELRALLLLSFPMQLGPGEYAGAAEPVLHFRV